jgi:hypothetical protein
MVGTLHGMWTSCTYNGDEVPVLSSLAGVRGRGDELVGELRHTGTTCDPTP